MGHASDNETGPHTGGWGPRLPALVPSTKTIAEVQAKM